MAKYLISFPSKAMVAPPSELAAVGRDARAVIDEAKAVGVHVFAGGIDDQLSPALVSADGTVAEGGYPWALKNGVRDSFYWSITSVVAFALLFPG